MAHLEFTLVGKIIGEELQFSPDGTEVVGFRNLDSDFIIRVQIEYNQEYAIFNTPTIAYDDAGGSVTSGGALFSYDAGSFQLGALPSFRIVDGLDRTDTIDIGLESGGQGLNFELYTNINDLNLIQNLTTPILSTNIYSISSTTLSNSDGSIHIYDQDSGIDISGTLYVYSLILSVAPDLPPNNPPSNATLSSRNTLENAIAGTVVGTVIGSDPDAGDVLSYSLDNNAGGRFEINPATGVLTVAAGAAINFETATSHAIAVKVTDTRGASAIFPFTITVGDLNEAPVITSDGGGAVASLGIVENTTAVTFVRAADPDAGTTLVYSITGGTDAALFSIVGNTGELAFVTPPDFEIPTDYDADNVYDVIVGASDGTFLDQQAIAVMVLNKNLSAPVITSDEGDISASVSIVENSSPVTIVTATDADAGTTIIYSIDGADAGLFTIDASTGELSFITAPDFESPTDFDADNVYDVIVRASDGPESDPETFSDEQSIAVTVTNANEVPVIVSNGGGLTASTLILENFTAVATVAALDPDAGTTIIYSISGGADAARFAIDADTGALRFRAAPNFEAPNDSGFNNIYNVTVRASDGEPSNPLSLSAYQGFAITVANVNERPIIVSNGGGVTASAAFADNGTAVATVTAIDFDFGATLAYSIGGGTDAAKFAIDSRTGALAFLATPDFAVPTDSNNDNVYDVIVVASDGALIDAQAIAITITEPTQSFTGTSRADSFSASDANGWTIAGLGGLDTLTGGASTDVIIGGKGNDVLSGGDGNDDFLIAAFDGVDSFNGGNGFDRIIATSANTLIGITSLVGIEAIGGDGFVGVAIVGSTADNVLDFSNVTLSAIDFIDARAGDDQVTGTAGNDVFLLGGGNDGFNGGAGDDTFIARPLDGRDTVDGGAGHDMIVAAEDDTRILLSTFMGIEEISGGGFAGVTIFGTAAAETMDFSRVVLTDIEAINGAGGKDIIVGSAGADRIIGGGGADTLTGGEGADVFAYLATADSARGAGADIIFDFDVGQDRIDLSGIDANTTVADDQAFVFIGTAAFTGPGQLRIGVDGNGLTALFGNINSNIAPEFQISFAGLQPIQMADILL